MKNKIDLCYLCGQKLDKDIDDDHIPPKQFYPSRIRKTYNPNLLTLPVHKSCNKSYEKDEVYFVNSLAPLAMGSYSGEEILWDISRQFKRPKGKRIGQMIYKEFEERPSGIFLPHGKIVKRFNGQRIRRVIWKITRGLFFKEKRKIFPEDIPYKVIEIYSPEQNPPPVFAYVRDTPSRGQNPDVFDYKYIDNPSFKNLHVWAMHFWNMLISLIAFHNPGCTCSRCKGQGQKILS